MKIKQRKVKDGEIIIVDDELNVGDGVTLIYYSDEEPATVIEIGPKGRWIKVQRDKAIRTDNNGMSDCQDCTFEKDEIDIYKQEMNVVALFLAKNCTPLEKFLTPVKKFYTSYKNWAMKKKEFVLKSSKVEEEMRKKGYRVIKNKGELCYVGIRLNTDSKGLVFNNYDESEI